VKIWGRVSVLAVGLAAFSALASANYHWAFVPAKGTFRSVPARFDINALPDHTVQFFISDQAPGPLMPGDSVTSIQGRVLQAARVWNDVSTSALRIRFGGFLASNTTQSGPGIDVVFNDDMPPGVLALTTPTFPGDLKFVENDATTFVPILRSKLQIRRDLTAQEQASYSDAFFLTLVHEFGHALGLQHTLTSSVMSTAITRGTSKASPLDADDIAGISLLYPAGDFAGSRGTISGRVTVGGNGVNLASVVALSNDGVAISTMTNPDGTYKLEGVPAGQYFLYAHPLPPAQGSEAFPAAIIPPTDSEGKQIAANLAIDTHFYPNTRDWTQATQLGVVNGRTLAGIDFAMESRPAGPAIFGMQTYGYQNGVAMPAPRLKAERRQALVFYAAGTTANNQMVPGLSVSVVGGTASLVPDTLRYYTQSYLLLYLDLPKVDHSTAVTLAVQRDNELYLLPAALTMVADLPPDVSTVTTQTNDDGSTKTLVSGSYLNAATRITFDGIPVPVLSANEDGTLTVVPPPAASGYQAVVEALNADGQTSLQAIGKNARPTYTYPVKSTPEISISPRVLTTGTDATVIITGQNTTFSGSTMAGFGTSDITVRKMWLTSPNTLMLNVSVRSGAPVSTSNVTVSTGLDLISYPGSMNIAAFDGQAPTLRVPIVNAVTGLAGVPAGGSVRINTAGLPDNLTGWTMLIGNQQTTFTSDAAHVITAKVPAGLSVGIQQAQLLGPGGKSTPPVLVQVDAAPPAIQGALDKSAADGKGLAVSASAPANGGDTIVLSVKQLGSGSELPVQSSVWIWMGGAILTPAAVTASTDGIALVEFVLPKDLPQATTADVTAGTAQSVPLAVGVDTRLSAVFQMPANRPQPAAAAAASSRTSAR
jgi:hypothetical protein